MVETSTSLETSVVFKELLFKMFTISFRRFFYVCDRVIVRNIRSRKFDPGANPGLQRRINAFRKEGIKLEDEDAEEFLEQSDSDFSTVGDAFKNHVGETEVSKVKLRQHIVKEKYFKEKMPNLLTWSEKEQIRHLVNTFPDEWTAEKIAESFPVTVPVVKKLLKYPWKPATEDRIARHDASAMRNWKELKEGTLHIPNDLRQHFLKFSDRTIPPLNKQSIKIDITNANNLGEFEKIIRSCATKDEQPKQNINDSFTPTDETSLTMEKENKQVVIKDLKRITLEELTVRIKKRLEKGNNINMPDQIMVKTINTSESEPTEELNKEIELSFEENKDDKLGVESEQNKKELAEYKEKTPGNVLAMPDYPLRIRIPKKAYKMDATYKVDDCYYDHDGRFLYRVLGMSDKTYKP